MDLLRGQILINQREESIIAEEALRDVGYVALYFSASWSPPCRIFLPRVKAMYEEALRRQVKLEIIFVPSDHENDEMFRYFSSSHGPWYATPVGPLAKSLRKKFRIVSIPTLTILKKDGRVVTKNARRNLEAHPDVTATLGKWFPEYE